MRQKEPCLKCIGTHNIIQKLHSTLTLDCVTLSHLKLDIAQHFIDQLQCIILQKSAQFESRVIGGV